MFRSWDGEKKKRDRDRARESERDRGGGYAREGKGMADGRRKGGSER